MYSQYGFDFGLHHSHFLSLPDGHRIMAKVPEHMQLAANIIGAIIPKNNQFFHDV